jgi:hypothetical protein
MEGAVGRSSRPRHLIAVLAAMCMMLVAAVPASAAGMPSLGVNDLRSDGVLVPNAAYDGAGDLDRLAGAGGRLYRGRLRLECVDPRHTGTFDFTGRRPGCGGVDYDALVAALAHRGITYLPILINFGADPGSAAAPVPPTVDGADGSPTRAEFAAFAAAAAARYGTGGTFWATCGCPARPIQAWEIWNEQNNGWWWGGRSSAEEYAAVFAATRAGLRASDPQARAVVGGLVWDPNGQSSFVAPESFIAALAAGNANAFDAVAVHPYTDARSQDPERMATEAIIMLDQAAAAVRRAPGPSPTGAPRQPIWVTEMGWSDLDAPAPVVAAALRSFLGRLDAGTRATNAVGPVLWYMLRDSGTVVGRDDRLGLRLTTPTGADAGAKPVWDAFAEAAAAGGDVALPDALGDSGPYVAPPPAAAPRSFTPAAAPRSARGAGGARIVAVRTKRTGAQVSLLVTCVRPAATCAGSVATNVKRALAAPARSARLHAASATRWSAKTGRTVRVQVRLSGVGLRALRQGRLKIIVAARAGAATQTVVTPVRA